MSGESKFIYGVSQSMKKIMGIGKRIRKDKVSINPPVEILWEITPECNKDCAYCGSKALRGCQMLPHDKIVRMASAIADSKMKPSEITLTGGEPGTVPFETLSDVMGIFRHARIRVKVITNGQMFETCERNNSLFLYNFDRIGLSINDAGSACFWKDFSRHYDNVTVVTNFGKHNLFDFDKISEVAKMFGHWQIQLTEGNEMQLPADGIRLIWEKTRNVPYAILADNAQPSHRCMAGTYGCSITYHGFAIPCLSMRSWMADEIPTMGNLLRRPFEDIWVDGFREWRSSGHKGCCRDSVEYPYLCLGGGGSAGDGGFAPFMREIQAQYYAVQSPGGSAWPDMGMQPTVSMYAVSAPSLTGQAVFPTTYNISVSSGGGGSGGQHSRA